MRGRLRPFDYGCSVLHVQADGRFVGNNLNAYGAQGLNICG